jgi:hypothetical protein
MRYKGTSPLGPKFIDILSNTTHNGVEYYAPVAQTAIKPLCSCVLTSPQVLGVFFSAEGTQDKVITHKVMLLIFYAEGPQDEDTI